MAMYLWSTRYNVSQKNVNFFDLKLFVIFFHPRVRYDVKCICGASIARGGGIIDTGEMEIEEAPIPLCILGYRDTKACRLKWLPKGKRLRGTWKCRKKFVPKVFPPSMCFMCLPRIHVFLFLLLPSLRSFIRIFI